ncbi:hypothetical protein CHS0354_025925 [Potamilus streckersoni]|uniref:Uncharacterized protein n=1 Tax=Potamilus streckersoni TaxID=2493646 RepID=A0AAE0T3W7_9BIVA|nr:hypothetical protein CHS0354_025925 [Potamilus streckersoni]
MNVIRSELFDKNSVSVTTEPEFKMDIPGLDKYKDAPVRMTSNFPQFPRIPVSVLQGL